MLVQVIYKFLFFFCLGGGEPYSAVLGTAPAQCSRVAPDNPQNQMLGTETQAPCVDSRLPAQRAALLHDHWCARLSKEEFKWKNILVDADN